MEKEVLCRVIKYLKEQRVAIGVIVTDRHKQTNKWLQETHPNIKHFCDVWHIAKGKISLVKSILLGTCSTWIGQQSGLARVKYNYQYLIIFVKHLIVLQGLRKKVQALAKQKDCKVIGKWEKSIINHLYWCVASTPEGNEATIKAKCVSLDNHLHNVHRGHSKDFPKCLHGKLRGRHKNKKWLKKCTCHHIHHIMAIAIYVPLFMQTQNPAKSLLHCW